MPMIRWPPRQNQEQSAGTLPISDGDRAWSRISKFEAGATIEAIGRAVGAQTGSIYHRFDSRDVLLAEVWLRAAAACQTAFFARLAGAEPWEAGLTAARYMAQRVREHPDEARLLLLHRREDFVDRGGP